MEKDKVDKGWINMIIAWIKEFIVNHPYIFGGFLGCQALSIGIGILSGSFAWYLIIIGVLSIILAFVAHEGT